MTGGTLLGQKEATLSVSSTADVTPRAHRTSCPGCLSDDLRHHPSSHVTRHSVLSCRGCGLRFWAEHGLPSTALPEPDPDLAESLLPDAEDTEDMYAAWVDFKRAGVESGAWSSTLHRLRGMLDWPEAPSVFDLGAGDGGFLNLARSQGFEVGGNDVMQGAVTLASSRYGIALELGDLAELDLGRSYDALTMWCVLAHVPDVDVLLQSVHDTLRPGGVLFLQTPRWSMPDGLALSALTASNGRLSRLVDRRIAGHHWQLHTDNSVRVLLERMGFEVLAVEPQARYSLKSDHYLASLGLSPAIAQRLGRGMDMVIARGLSPRIVLDVYARRR